MKPRPEIIGEKVELLGLYNKVSPEEMEAARVQALKHFESAAGQALEDEISISQPAGSGRKWRWQVLAGFAATIAVAVLLPTDILQSAPAVLADTSGSRKIQYGEIVRPTGDMSALLTMADGPRVETRSMSEFLLERTDDGGTLIHLNDGSMIVDAAALQDGNLYVQTRDMVASVSGAVSLIKAEEQGSRVAAIAGEVRVQQGSTEKTLRSGDQVATSLKMESISVKEELTWSREVMAHVALLQQAGGTIEGVVSRSDTGAPLAGAQVSLTLISATTNALSVGGSTMPGVPPVMTDKEGRFSFAKLDPGTYRVFAAAQGFAPRAYGQRDASGIGTPIFLTIGQTLGNATIQLMPEGTISGKISDDSGQPVVGTPVQVFTKTGYSSGTYASFRKTTTDDRGEYRVYGLRPGSYYLGVGDELAPQPISQAGIAAGQTSRSGYMFQLFPGVDRFDQAVPLELTGGNELAIDMKTRRQATYRIRGSVVDSTTGRPPTARVSMKLASSGPVSNTRTENLAVNYDSGTGAFEVNVASGSYILQANTQIFDAAVRAAGEAAWSMFPTARVAVVVKDKDLDGVKLTLTRPAAVAGRVRFEGGTPVALSNATLHLEPAVAGGTTWTPPTAFVKSDGTFRVDGLIDGEYAVGFGGRPRGFYVRSIQYEGTDILAKPWRFSGSGSGTVEVILRAGTSRVSGTVTDGNGLPSAGSQVVLVPEQRNRTEFYPVALSDQGGRFSFSDVPPGEYRIFSWVSVGVLDYHNPEFIQRYQQQSRTVRITESSDTTVDVRVIPLR